MIRESDINTGTTDYHKNFSKYFETHTQILLAVGRGGPKEAVMLSK